MNVYQLLLVYIRANGWFKRSLLSRAQPIPYKKKLFIKTELSLAIKESNINFDLSALKVKGHKETPLTNAYKQGYSVTTRERKPKTNF